MNGVRPVVRHVRRAGLLLLVIAVFMGAMLPQAVSAAASAASYAQPGEGRHYTVQVGDTLSEIAMRFGTTVEAIMDANGLRNPNHIYVGQVLVIPGGGEMGAAGCTTYHQVRPGETMTGIASYYGVDVYSLARANNIYDLNQVYVGQSLCIPGGMPGMPMPEPMPMPGQPKPMPMPGQPMPAPMPMPGQPMPAPMPMPEPMPMPQQPPMDGGTMTYVVRPGDTLGEIATRYNTTVEMLAYVNGIKNPHRLEVGQVLIIPAGGAMPMPMPEQKPMQPMDNAPMQPMSPGPMPQPMPMDGGSMQPMPPGPMPQPMSMDSGSMQPMHAWPPKGDGSMQPMPPGQMPQPPGPDFVPPGPQPPPPSMPSEDGQFWLGSYYSNKDLSGDPLYKRHDPQLRFEWGQGGPGGGIPNDFFSVLWTRSAYFKAGRYRFFATTDDGVRVFVNDQKLIDAWRVQAPSTFFGDIELREGYQLVRVEYFEEAGNATAIVHWQPLQ